MVTFFNVKVKLPAFLTMKIIGPGRFVKLSSPENFEFHYIKYSRQQKRRKLAFIHFVMSFIYSRNNTGPKIASCGTPDKTDLGED